MALERQVRAKLLGKRDPEQEREAKEWIESVLGEKLSGYEDALKDGQILCRVMNKLKPGSIAKVNSAGGQFKMMENINNFQKAIQEYGVPKIDVFQTVDLYEKKDISNVTSCLFALGRTTYDHPEWPGPWLGPRPAHENKREFSDETVQAGKAIIGLQAGSNKGASQAGQNIGASRKIILGK
ncbi:unnamed protein product [Allacma fusca]|uniref:Calponin-homology (CH) domain-containing protein n=1 Tax=Allacma fusca TaxID=39272 RepID=A0A8J2KA52_9HEXA|nr:unnamed protein product [Allacma fusca]